MYDGFQKNNVFHQIHRKTDLQSKLRRNRNAFWTTVTFDEDNIVSWIKRDSRVGIEVHIVCRYI